jgi:hypothetical protein
MSKLSAPPTGWAIKGAGALLCLTVMGCDTQALKEGFGFGRQAPDEYQVVERAPLSLPPDFQLRPPRPGAQRPQETDIRELAERVLMGRGKPTPARERSPGELALLGRAGAAKAEPDIRQTISRENGGPAVESDGFVDNLMFWDQPDADATIVDPVGESARLRKNADEGRPVTDGETPTMGSE